MLAGAGALVEMIYHLQLDGGNGWDLTLPLPVGFSTPTAPSNMAGISLAFALAIGFAGV
jgi:hypothetical protein